MNRGMGGMKKLFFQSIEGRHLRLEEERLISHLQTLHRRASLTRCFLNVQKLA